MRIENRSEGIVESVAGRPKHHYDPACVCCDCCNYERQLHNRVQEQKRDEARLTFSVAALT